MYRRAFLTNKNKNNNKNTLKNNNKNTLKNKNTIIKLKDQLSSFKEKSEKLLKEIDEHKKKAVELNKDNKKADAILEIKRYNMKELEIKKITVMIHNVKVMLIHLLKQEKELMKAGGNNNMVSFKNPMHSKKTLKRSNGSRNLFSKYNSEYGKLKRNYKLAINASPEDVLSEIMKDSGIENKQSDEELLKELEKLEKLEKNKNNFTESERNLLRELEELEELKSFQSL